MGGAIRFRAVLLAVALVLVGPWADPWVGEPLQAQEGHLLVVVGLGGDEDHRERFHRYAVRLITAAEGGMGLPPENTLYLGERPDDHPDEMDGRATRDELVATLERLGREAGATDAITVIFIGHATVRNGEPRINLPGPDLTAAEIGMYLASVGDRPLTLILASSSAGGFVEAVSAPNRVIMAATRSGQENEPRFAGPLVDALAGDGADTDKDGRVSMLEAFNYTRIEVERSYSTGNQLRTEHALLDDDGDGVGTEEPPVEGGDGIVAARRFLSPAPALPALAGSDPVLAGLYEEREAIRERVNALQSQRASMETEAYQARLEELLVELALKNREIRAREAGGGP